MTADGETMIDEKKYQSGEKQTLDGVTTNVDDPVQCYHTNISTHANFTTSELLHKKEKTDYITYQFICQDCGKHLDLTWKMWCMEDLEENKILYRADGNQAVKSVLDDDKFTEELVEACCFDMGDSEWLIRARVEEMLESIRDRIDKERKNA